MSRLNNAFAQFHDSIQLTTLSEGRINSAWGRLHDYLHEKYGGVSPDVFIQGSYANDTAVKPADESGEYDLDIVCVYGEPDTAAGAIERLTAVLSEDADLRARLDPNESGRPCVRLRYADDRDGYGFHVDIVPARGINPQDVVDVPMRGQEGWRQSAPFPYTRWCQQQSPMFLRVVRFLKRWRGVHGDGSIASIMLQVLTAEHLDIAATSDAEALASTLAKMHNGLALSPPDPPVILNPVLPTENLAERWKPEDYQTFRRELDEAVQLSRAALMESDQQTSHDLWRRLLGEDFPDSPADVTAGGETAPPPPPPDYPDHRQQAPSSERYG
jgi:Second Messenger Oligonucleotide or Dinucleotide Synthetase domain